MCHVPCVHKLPSYISTMLKEKKMAMHPASAMYIFFNLNKEKKEDYCHCNKLNVHNPSPIIYLLFASHFPSIHLRTPVHNTSSNELSGSLITVFMNLIELNPSFIPLKKFKEGPDF